MGAFRAKCLFRRAGGRRRGKRSRASGSGGAKAYYGMGAPVRVPGGEKEGPILERNEAKRPLPVAAPHAVNETEKVGKRWNRGVLVQV